MHKDISSKIDVLFDKWGDHVFCRECSSNVFYTENKQCVNCNTVYEEVKPIQLSPEEKDKLDKFEKLLKSRPLSPSAMDMIFPIERIKNCEFSVEPNDVEGWTNKGEDK